MTPTYSSEFEYLLRDSGICVFPLKSESHPVVWPDVTGDCCRWQSACRKQEDVENRDALVTFFAGRSWSIDLLRIAEFILGVFHRNPVLTSNLFWKHVLCKLFLKCQERSRCRFSLLCAARELSVFSASVGTPGAACNRKPAAWPCPSCWVNAHSASTGLGGRAGGLILDPGLREVGGWGERARAYLILRLLWMPSLKEMQQVLPFGWFLGISPDVGHLLSKESLTICISGLTITYASLFRFLSRCPLGWDTVGPEDGPCPPGPRDEWLGMITPRI